MSDVDRARIAPILARQHELITTAQARHAGVRGGPLARLVEAGTLEPIAPRLYGTVGTPMTWHRTLRAALLRAGPHAVVSHRAAARLLGVPMYEAASPEMTVASKRNFSHPGVVVHQSRDLAYIPPVSVEGLPCTPPRRLAVDIGAVLGEVAYTTVIRELRRMHGVTWKQLAAILELHSRRGRDGCGSLRRQVERYYGMAGIPGSTLEQQLLDDMIDAAFPLPECQHPVPTPWGRPYVLDFAYVDALVAVEVDGPHHRRPEVAARDRRRDQYLASVGWLVLRFDERTVLYAPMRVLRGIRGALEARGACTLSPPSVQQRVQNGKP